MDLMKSYIEYNRIEKAAKAEKDRIKKELVQYMQENENEYLTEPGKYKLFFDGMTANYSEYTTTKFDTKKFKTEKPKLYNKYSYTENANRFSCS